MITNSTSGSRIDEIAKGIYRIHHPLKIDALPDGFGVCQFLIDGEEPLLFHTGYRRMAALVAEAVSTVVPLERLRWVGYSHLEGDESGAMNELLAAAPNATPFASDISVMVSLADIADRAPRPFADGEEFEIGGRRMKWMHTPHVPHGWDCGVLFDIETKTLLCGDLFTQGGSDCPPVTGQEVLSASEMFRKPMDYFAHSTGTSAILERLAGLKPELLACMHGSAYRGDGAGLLRALSAKLERAANAAA
jgi:flavorubredoxin